MSRGTLGSVPSKPKPKAKAIHDEPNEAVLFVPEVDPREKRLVKNGVKVWERVERNLAIVERRVRGDRWEDIANDHGVTIRRCKQIVEAYRAANPTLRHHDPVEVVDELLDGYAADIRALNETYDKANLNGNVSGAVGAVNSRMNAREKIAELLQAIGVLPHDLGTMHLIIEGRVVAEKVFAVLERYDLPNTIFEELEQSLAEAEGAPIELPGAQ